MKERILRVLICLGSLTVLVWFSWVEKESARDFFPDTAAALSAKLDIDVTVNRYNISEEGFFPYLYEKLEELYELFPEAAIRCSIDGETSLDGFARVELDNGLHYLYLGYGGVIYELKSDTKIHKWDSYLSGLLGEDGYRFDGHAASGNIMRYSLDFGYISGYFSTFYYHSLEMDLWNAKVVFCQGNADGFTLKIQQINDRTKEEYIEELSVHTAKALPDFNTEEERRDYFLQKYPDMDYYHVYSLRDEKLEDVGEVLSIKENNAEYAYLMYSGRYYELEDRENASYYSINMATDFFSRTSYDLREKCTWERDDAGSCWQNFPKRIFYIKRDIGTGENFIFQINPPTDALPAESELGTLEYGEVLDVAVYREGENEPFQIFQTSSIMYVGEPVFFEDFNADGYLDLTVLYYYGCNGGSASHYLWSPSKEQFVECPEELSYYGSYSVDMENRRLSIHKHASAMAGSDYTYQWENETDFTLIKCCWYDLSRDEGGTDKWFFHTESYEDGRTFVFLDDLIEINDDEKQKVLFDFYYEDLIWENTIWDDISSMHYQLYFTEGPQRDEYGEKVSGSYMGHLYVVDEELHLKKWIEIQSKETVTGISLEEGDEKEKIKLVICYTDGSIKRYSVFPSQSL